MIATTRRASVDRPPRLPRRPPQGPPPRRGHPPRRHRRRLPARRPGRPRPPRRPRPRAAGLPRHRRRREPPRRLQARREHPRPRRRRRTASNTPSTPTPASPRPTPSAPSSPPSTPPRRRSRPALAAEDFAAAMTALARLRAPIDAFFDTTTVNADEPGGPPQPALPAQPHPRGDEPRRRLLRRRGRLRPRSAIQKPYGFHTDVHIGKTEAFHRRLSPRNPGVAQP